MREQFFSNQNALGKNELLEDRQDLMHEKKENLEKAKEQAEGRFEFSEKESETVKDAIEIRKEIRKGISSNEYLAEIDNQTKGKISDLALKINGSDISSREHIFIKDDNGNVAIQFEDGTIKNLEDADVELVESLEKYFDSFRETHNARRFRDNVKSVKEQVSQEVEKRKLTFYSKDDKNDELVERIHAKYEKAGFSEDEIRKFLEFSQLKNTAWKKLTQLSQLVNILRR